MQEIDGQFSPTSEIRAVLLKAHLVKMIHSLKRNATVALEACRPINRQIIIQPDKALLSCNSRGDFPIPDRYPHTCTDALES